MLICSNHSHRPQIGPFILSSRLHFLFLTSSFFLSLPFFVSLFSLPSSFPFSLFLSSSIDSSSFFLPFLLFRSVPLPFLFFSFSFQLPYLTQIYSSIFLSTNRCMAKASPRSDTVFLKGNSFRQRLMWIYPI